jgi:hypothetical protein
VLHSSKCGHCDAVIEKTPLNEHIHPRIFKAISIFFYSEQKTVVIMHVTMERIDDPCFRAVIAGT